MIRWERASNRPGLPSPRNHSAALRLGVYLVSGPNPPGFIGRAAGTILGILSIGVGIAGLLIGGRETGGGKGGVTRVRPRIPDTESSGNDGGVGGFTEL